MTSEQEYRKLILEDQVNRPLRFSNPELLDPIDLEPIFINKIVSGNYPLLPGETIVLEQEDFCFTWEPNQIIITTLWEDLITIKDLTYQFSVCPVEVLRNDYNEVFFSKIYNGKDFEDDQGYFPQLFSPNKENCTHIGCLAKLRLHVTLSKESKGKLIRFNCKITRPQWKYKKEDFASMEDFTKRMHE